MSRLKYYSKEELRRLILRLESYRAEQRRLQDQKRQRIRELEDEIWQHGRLDHNAGQREAWARYYLARKDLGEMN